MVEASTAVAIAAPAPAQPRLTALVATLGTVFGAILTLGGLLITFGGWRATVDSRDAELDRRLTVVEQTQRTNLPIFAAMQRDVSYLADRARRDDEARDRRLNGER